MAEKQKSIAENIVVLAIILVLIQTFVEDLAVLMNWPWDYRYVLVWTGFFFDVFFTVEFLTRFFLAWRRNRTGEYFYRERGWIDFLASVPLVLFNSGPNVLALLYGNVTIIGVGGFLNVLKIIKAVRIARILRLLRVLKIFKQIKYTDSVMAQRHIAKITSILVTSFVVVLLGITIITSFISIPNVEQNYYRRNMNILDFVREQRLGERRDGFLEEFLTFEGDALVLKEDGETVYSRYGNEYYDTYFGPGDYIYTSRDGLELFIDFRPVNREQAQSNLAFFLIIMTIVFIYLFYYSPHFAITVTDPIHIMRRGMTEGSYNLEVKIPETYRNDDIYLLAAEYNRKFLPMKDRSEGGEEVMSELTMDNMGDIFDSPDDEK
ncbi:MAG: ion transporter [Spirochaetia bacterium]